jgi:hypothetical protein
MSASDRFERDFGAVLADLAEPHYPDYFDDVLELAVSRMQRPAWTFPERWLPMSAIALPQTQRVPRAWRTMGILVVLALLLAAVLIAVGSQRHLPPPFGLAANGSITYSKDGDIYVRPATTGPERLLVGGPEVDAVPSYSRDGSNLLFVRLKAEDSDIGSLMIANADGTNVRALLADTRFEAASWSPAGTEIAVIVDAGGVGKLQILSVEGRTPPRTIEMPVEPNGWIDWRPPDGRELVFRGRDRMDSFAIYTVPPDGAVPRRVSPQGSSERWMGAFALSPDGSHMAFTGWVGPVVSLQVLDIDAGRARRLFDALPPPAADTGVGPVHDGGAVYSPDGSTVVFGRYWDEHDGTLNHQLWMAAADGDGRDAMPIVPVTRSRGGVDPFGEIFSPDATRILVKIDPSRTSFVLDPRTGSTEDMEWTEDVPGWQRLPE